MMETLVWILAFGYAVGIAGVMTMRKIASEEWVRRIEFFWAV